MQYLNCDHYLADGMLWWSAMTLNYVLLSPTEYEQSPWAFNISHFVFQTQIGVYSDVSLWPNKYDVFRPLE